MFKLRARVLVVAVALGAAVPAALIAGATSGPATATAAANTTGPSGPTGPTAPNPKAPSAVTGPASRVGQTSAILNGTVDPKGLPTDYYFQYGTTGTYGLQTSPAGAGSGSGNVGVHSTLTGLTKGTTYHYRLVAQNPSGTTEGADQTFTPGLAQSQVRFIGRMGFVSPGRVIGVEAGCFGGDTRCYGHVTMSHNGIVIGQRDFEIAPNSGGFQNIEISSQGEQMMMSYNNVWHLLPVTVAVTTSTGQKTSQVMTLARWLWH